MQVVDLLVAMANAAAHSPRVNLILDPYPSIVDPSDHDRLAMDPKVEWGCLAQPHLRYGCQ